MAEPHDVLNRLAPAAARDALSRCCASARWVEGVLGRRPFSSAAELFEAADAVWSGLERADFLEAFAGHPRIGVDLDALRAKFAATASWSSEEQSGVAGADEATLQALRAGNLAYEARFGHLFIVCATGKSAREMLGLLEARLEHAPDVELRVAAAEQAKITRLRLGRLTA